MTFFHKNIEKNTISNNFYRKVLYTHKNGKNNGMQFVLMSLKPGVEIGMEVHKDHDQFIRIEKGKGKAIIKKGIVLKSYKLYDGVGIIIPSGTYHNIINTGKKKLKLFTIYTPPEHKPYLVQKEKEKQKGGEMDSILYKQKYLKYKQKYLELKGGSENELEKEKEKIIKTLIRQASRWSVAAEQDKVPMIAVLHANYGTGFLWALKDIMSQQDIEKYGKIDFLKFEKEITKIQDKATINMAKICNEYAPPASYLTSLGGEGNI